MEVSTDYITFLIGSDLGFYFQQFPVLPIIFSNYTVKISLQNGSK